MMAWPKPVQEATSAYPCRRCIPTRGAARHSVWRRLDSDSPRGPYRRNTAVSDDGRGTRDALQHRSKSLRSASPRPRPSETPHGRRCCARRADVPAREIGQSSADHRPLDQADATNGRAYAPTDRAGKIGAVRCPYSFSTPARAQSSSCWAVPPPTPQAPSMTSPRRTGTAPCPMIM